MNRRNAIKKSYINEANEVMDFNNLNINSLYESN